MFPLLFWKAKKNLILLQTRGKGTTKLFPNIVVEGAGRESSGWGCRWDAVPNRVGEKTRFLGKKP